MHNIVLLHPIKDDYFKKFPFINRPRNTLLPTIHSCLPPSQLRSLSQSPPMSPQYVDRYYAREIERELLRSTVLPVRSNLRYVRSSTTGSRVPLRRQTVHVGLADLRFESWAGPE